MKEKSSFFCYITFLKITCLSKIMIILTGGAGFIGSCFLAKLNENGKKDILLVDSLGSGDKWKNLSNKHFSEFIHKNKFRELLKEGYFNSVNIRIEAIIHLGACSATTEKNADYLMDNNFLYSKELATFALKNEIKFIYASSAATYGDGNNGYSDETIDNITPLNCYGLSKHLFDMWIVNHKFDTRVTGIKFFNVFGPNEQHKGGMRSMFCKAFEQIQETGKVNLFKSYDPNYGNGGQKRDFIYVKDCTEILWKALNGNDFYGIYNLGTGEARTWNDLANAVFAAMNRIPNIQYIDMPDELKKQYQYFTQADTNKLLNKLGRDWKFTSMEDAAADYIQNYLQTKVIL